MEGLVYLAVFAVIAVIIFILVLRIYNRRLDRIVRGEEKERHSQIPDPSTSLTVIYRTALMTLVISIFLLLTARTTSLQSELQELRFRLTQLENSQERHWEMLEAQCRVVGEETYEVVRSDLEKMTAEVTCNVGLREYTEDTVVALRLNGQSYELTKKASGTYGANLIVDITGCYDETELLIQENDKTIVEQATFPMEIWMDVFPMCSMTLQGMDYSETFGMVRKVTGNYTVSTDKPEQIEKVTMTYIADGTDYKTIDITKNVQEGTSIVLDEKPNTKNNFGYRMEILTKSGETIQESGILVGTDTEFFRRITDKNGKVLLENK